MPSTPWLKWFPSDWQSDIGLRLCGAAARGVWIEAINLMHYGNPYGTLTTSTGSSVTREQFAALTCLSLNDVVSGFEELERAGVYSKTDEGVIFSRKLSRNNEIVEQRRAAGRLGAAARYSTCHSKPAMANGMAKRGSGSGSSISSSDSYPDRDPATTVSTGGTDCSRESAVALLRKYASEFKRLKRRSAVVDFGPGSDINAAFKALQSRPLAECEALIAPFLELGGREAAEGWPFSWFPRCIHKLESEQPKSEADALADLKRRGFDVG